MAEAAPLGVVQTLGEAVGGEVTVGAIGEPVAAAEALDEPGEPSSDALLLPLMLPPPPPQLPVAAPDPQALEEAQPLAEAPPEELAQAPLLLPWGVALRRGVDVGATGEAEGGLLLLQLAPLPLPLAAPDAPPLLVPQVLPVIRPVAVPSLLALPMLLPLLAPVALPLPEALLQPLAATLSVPQPVVVGAAPVPLPQALLLLVSPLLSVAGAVGEG